ncbi:MAG: Addiction module toxin RelE [Lacticaseibacillus casei]|jgi:hypothetical protein|uniref:type II toxin-antitoxin system RelE/ParE family toxin n=1 Tax=Lacticaseibacillus paracasei TaxID=1597 RepID=UPI000F43BA99|nr:type II toxin-antitoxin system RelE/ParE family toxin [Lacticaseibacillus paracasei]RND53709.1 hypothetical protein FAM18113_01873 [Lacticaseibacillus paracasei]
MALIYFNYLPSFNKEWGKQNLSQADKESLEAQILDYLSAVPESRNGRLFPGQMIRDTGGAYKLRYADDASNYGKRGSYRVIYVVVHNDTLYFLTVFPKHQKENLSNAEVASLKKVVQRLKRGEYDHEKHT